MNAIKLLCVTALLAGTAALSAADSSAPAAADYPLKTCVVSGEELGNMGPPFDYIYRPDNQPPRLVRFCCSGCLSKFKRNPAKYLEQIDAATRAKPRS